MLGDSHKFHVLLKSRAHRRRPTKHAKEKIFPARLRAASFSNRLLRCPLTRSIDESAHWHGKFRRRRPDGRRTGQGQGSGRDDHDHRGQRRTWPLCISRGRLKPGAYKLTIRATGYDAPAADVTIGAQPANCRSEAQQSRHLRDRRSARARGMGNEREVPRRLRGLPQPQRRPEKHVRRRKVDGHANSHEKLRAWGLVHLSLHAAGSVRAQPGDEEFAKYLASINLSSKRNWDFELKSFPRPEGKSHQSCHHGIRSAAF